MKWLDYFKKPPTVDDIIAASFCKDRWHTDDGGWSYTDSITGAVMKLGKSGQTTINGVHVSQQVKDAFWAWRRIPYEKEEEEKARALADLYTMIHPTQPWPKR